MKKETMIEILNTKLQELFELVDEINALAPESVFETNWDDLFAEIKNLQEAMGEMSEDSIMKEYHEVELRKIHCAGADEGDFCGTLEDHCPLDFDSETFLELSEDHDSSTVTEFRHDGFNGVWTGTFEEFKDTFFPGGSFCRDTGIERLEMDIVFDATVYHAVVQTKAESHGIITVEAPDQDGFRRIVLTRNWRNASSKTTLAYLDTITGRVAYTSQEARDDKRVQEIVKHFKAGRDNNGKNGKGENT